MQYSRIPSYGYGWLAGWLADRLLAAPSALHLWLTVKRSQPALTCCTDMLHWHQQDGCAHLVAAAIIGGVAVGPPTE